MDWQRTLLLGGIVVVVILLFQKWNEFEESRKPALDDNAIEAVLPSVSSVPQAETTVEDAVPTDEVPTVADDEKKALPAQPDARLISVKTDVLEVRIDTNGGDIVQVALPQHLAHLDSGDPLVLLNRTSTHTYVAQSGLVGRDGTDKSGHRPVFVTDAAEYVLQEGSDDLEVKLRYQDASVAITKTLVFRRGDYLVDVNYQIDNRGNTDWKGNLYAQIKRDSSIPESDSGMGMQPHVGPALTTNEEHYKKFKFDDINDSPVKETVTGGWVAMLQHYFISAWIPQPDQKNSYSLRKLSGADEYAFGFVGPAINVAPGQQGELRAGFYAGPKDQRQLEKIAPYLDLTIDYGWAWWISKPLFALLTWMHNLVGNWGWAILLLTLCVRIPMYPLFAKSARSMAKMRKLQPEMTRLKELYGDDRQRMSQEMMGLYKKHKTNPMSGCLPMLIPMPIFIGLYYMLFESIELRHADWFWVADLSVKDPLFILPVLMGLSMWFQQKLNPQPAEASMAAAMKMMPVIFTFMFMWFPAGLVLYWTVNNLFSIIQGWIVNRQMDKT